MAKYIIYLTTNLECQIDGQNRKYIGIHRENNLNIFSGYIGCGVNIYKPSTYMFPKTPFQHAVKKYGTKAFKREILFVYDTPIEALKKERELVNDDWIRQSWTYNVVRGGGGYKDCWKPIYQFDLKGNLIKEWESVLDVSDFYGYELFKFYNAAYMHRSFNDYFWAYDKEINVKNYSINRLKHQTCLYDLNGKYLMDFDSRKACAEYLGCNPQSISNAVRNQNKIKNHYVTDFMTDLFEPKPRITLKNGDFYLYHKDGEFIGKYSGKNIMEPLNEHSWRKISNAINENLGWYKDYYISIDPVNEVPNKKYLHRRELEVYTKTGDLVEVLSTIKDAKEKYNLSYTDLDLIMKGIKTHDEYVFVYSK